MRRHSRLTHLLSVVLTLLLAFPPVTAFAGQEEARKYFKQAKQAYSEGEYERAAKLLEKAYAEEPNLTYQYNRVRALEGAGNYEKALEVLNNYEQPMLDANGFQDIKDIKQSLQKKVEKEPEPAEDEAADNFKETESKSGDDDATAETDTADTDRESASADTNRIVGWGLLGVGAASAITGTVFVTGLALPEETRNDVYQKNTLSDRQKKMRNNHRILTVVFYGVAAGTGIAGATILLNQDSSTSPAASKATIRPRLVPYASPDRAGAMLRFQF